MSTWLISTNGLLLTATSGLPSVGATPPVGGAPTASAEITVSNRLVTATAPDMVVFEITNFSGFDTSGPTGSDVYNPRFHELYYFWDFGDTTYTSFTAPDRLNSTHNNPNKMYGPWGRHVYRNAGSYSPKCTIYEPSSGKYAIAYLNAGSTDSGTAGTATAALDVADPDTTFAGTNTVFMSPSGSFSNAPAGCVQITSGDISAVMQNATAALYGTGTPKRLMLNRGESYTFGGHGFLYGGGTRTLHVVAGGDAGAKPQVTQTGSWYDNNTTTGTTDLVFDGISWVGEFDSTAYPMTPDNAFYNNHDARTTYPSTVLLHDCAFDGYNLISTDQFGENVRHWALVDTFITNWGGAGFFDYGAEHTTMLGCKFESHPNTLADTGGMCAPFRDGGTPNLVIFASDFFNRQGGGIGNVTEQAAIRVNSEQTADRKSYVGCNIFEAGAEILQYARSDGEVVADPPSNHICEKNFLLCGAGTQGVIGTSQPATTFRNNIFVLAPVDYTGSPSPAATGLDVVIKATYRNEGGVAETQSAPIYAYSNTFVVMKPDFDGPNEFISLRSGNQSGLGTGDLLFTNTIDSNNILHKPVAASPIDLGLADTTDDFKPLRTGYRTSSTPTLRRQEMTPHSVLDFDAQTAAFTGGSLLTGGTSGATAYIGLIVDNGTTGTLYLGEITGGPFVDGETITDASGGSATANGGSRDCGAYDDFIPLTGSSVIGAYTTGKVAFDDYYGNIRDTVLSGLTRSTYSTGAHEPSLES